ncbi:MAG: TauD/TfdA family dioxygenase [Alphaproteobacteria bacterium]|jgi:taurine dioxygenase|nr:TauD/TfdA family dioxygenase [Alphaproteobacteria bacterium]
MAEINTMAAIEVIPSGDALGAEVRGVDFARPVPDEVRDRIVQIWAEHLVLLFRGLSLDDDQLLATAGLFGGQQAAKSRDFFIQAGVKPGDNDRVATRPGISIISNVDSQGKAGVAAEADRSLSLKWHSDNSYVEVPPTGSLLHAHVVPVNGGGETSFSNQYLAYENLPDDLKAEIEGKHCVHDDHRNTSAKLRPTKQPPKSRHDITGPKHPLVRVHPVTGKRALYLGRHYEWPSSYIVELCDEDSEALLARLWDAATRDAFNWTHDDWRAGDLLMWDNRCTMHARSPVDHSQARVMHRTLIKGDPVISAWEKAGAVAE